MGSFSIWHWLIVLAVILLLFGGRGKISQIMGDFGKGLKSFKKSMREDESLDASLSDTDAPTPPRVLPSDAHRTGDAVRSPDRVIRP
jgi:sec-independent protein translocase protein TatA